MSKKSRLLDVGIVLAISIIFGVGGLVLGLSTLTSVVLGVITMIIISGLFTFTGSVSRTTK